MYREYTDNFLITVKWTNIKQVVVNNCKPDMVWIPHQERLHEKRCLLDPEIDGRVPYAPPIGPKTPVYYPPATTKKPTYLPPTKSSGYGVPKAPVYGPPATSYGVPKLVTHG